MESGDELPVGRHSQCGDMIDLSHDKVPAFGGGVMRSKAITPM
jgi:hypothetical protein